MEIILSYSDTHPIKSYDYFYGYCLFGRYIHDTISAVLSVATGAGGFGWNSSAREVCMYVSF